MTDTVESDDVALVRRVHELLPVGRLRCVLQSTLASVTCLKAALVSVVWGGVGVSGRQKTRWVMQTVGLLTFRSFWLVLRL